MSGIFGAMPARGEAAVRYVRKNFDEAAILAVAAKLAFEAVPSFSESELATIAAMQRCGAERTRIVAALGPMIRQPSYEVGPELVARFRSESEANARFFQPSPRPGHALFDLAGYIAARLAAAGIAGVEDLGHCTYGDAARFFSYRRSTHRREADYGRHVNAIALMH